jgi:hypothetical protein
LSGFVANELSAFDDQEKAAEGVARSNFLPQGKNRKKGDRFILGVAKGKASKINLSPFFHKSPPTDPKPAD